MNNDNTNPMMDWTMQMVRERLEHKSNVLNRTLPPAITQLEAIHQQLRVKALHEKQQNDNLEKAVQLAQMATSIQSIRASMATILRNVSPVGANNQHHPDQQSSDLGEKVMLNASLAICGSGAVASMLRQLLEALSRVEFNGEGDDTVVQESCAVLRDACRTIETEVTADIPTHL